jgi:putative phosphoesterase
MKVALIGDVHANLPALEAVLAHAHGQGVEAIWNIGDFVGYGAFPDEVVRRLRQENARSIIGNYDLKALRQKKSKKPEKRLAFQWAYDHLSEESREYLRHLPEEIVMGVEGYRVLLTHASPASNEEPLTPDTPDERLRELAQMASADVVIFGHSHQPFVRQVMVRNGLSKGIKETGVWFINTGSVGRPDDGDPRACYAILHIGPESLEVEHYRLEYDIERAVAAVRDYGLPENFARMILQGRSLDDVR